MSETTQFGGIAPWHQDTWDWRAAGNFIGGGSGAGLLAVGWLAGSTVWPVALLGMALIGGGLACVWLEIGKPWRALNVFRHPATSWMSREALVAPPLLAAAGLAALTESRALLGLAALLGVAFVACQARILTGAKGIPAWREPRVVPLILATAAAEGTGLALLLPGRPDWLAPLLVALLAVRFACWRAYFARLEAKGAPRRAVAAGRGIDRMLGLAFHLLPAGLAALGLAAPAGLLAAAGGWLLKFTLVNRMAFNQGFSITKTPSRGAGPSGPGSRPGW